MARLVTSLLGTFQVTLDDVPLLSFRSDKERALLAYLAVEVDRPHRREVLTGLLWPDQEESLARKNLSKALFYLRQTLQDAEEDIPFLLVTPASVQFNPNSDFWVDVTTFSMIISECRAHSHRHLSTCDACHPRLRESIQLYRGDFLAGMTFSGDMAFDEWATMKREALRRQASMALRVLTTFYERRESYDEALHYAWQQVELSPWEEEAHRQLMRLMACNGQRLMALAHYNSLRDQLWDELGVEPDEETQALLTQIKQGSSTNISFPASYQLHRSPLPTYGTPLIGREEELSALTTRLLEPGERLITLVGEGGVGKSRLAVAVAEQLRFHFLQGVWFIPVAEPGYDPAHTLDLPMMMVQHPDPKRLLFRYLKSREMLLIFDGFEPHLEEAGLLLEILDHAPQITILVTSRERLHLQRESVFRITGLPVPATAEETFALPGSSVSLFEERARRSAEWFRVNDANLAAVVQICRFLQGSPLGIELAAAWAAQLTPVEIARLLQRDPDALALPWQDVPERHRSLRAVFEASWSLLSPRQRLLLAQATIFEGGFTPEAVKSVLGASLGEMSSLVEKSLMQHARDGRYDLHEVVRYFAAEKLKSKGEVASEEIQASHSQFYLGFVAQHKAIFEEERYPQALREVYQEIGNIQKAWQWAAERRRAELLQSALSGLRYLYFRYHAYQLGEQAFRQAIEGLRQQQDAGQLLSALLVQRAHFLNHLADYEQAVAAAQEGIALAQASGDKGNEAHGYAYLAEALWSQEKYPGAQLQLERALVLARTAGLREVELFVILGLTGICYGLNDVGLARQYGEAALRLSRTLGKRVQEVWVPNFLGPLSLALLNYATAWFYVEQGRTLYHRMSEQPGQVGSLTDLLTLKEYYLHARSYYEQALETVRALSDQLNHVQILMNLASLSRYLGDYTVACAYGQQALATSRAIGHLPYQIQSLTYLGHALRGLRRGEEATQRYLQAQTLAQELGQPQLALGSQAALAELTFLQGNSEEAQRQVAEVLSHLEYHGVGDLDEPYWTLFICYRVFQAVEDPRALDVLRMVHTALYEIAAHLPL